MKRSPRYLTSLVMTAVYLLVIFAPLAPAALHSGVMAHALTGECAGDCRICGCAPERSAARACCCWQKKLALQTAAATKIAGSSCKNEKTPLTPMASCCDKQNHAGHDVTETIATKNTPENDSLIPTLKTLPCGSARQLAISGMENIQHYPYIHIAGIPAPPTLPYSPLAVMRLVSRDCEPPKPPPKVSVLS